MLLKWSVAASLRGWKRISGFLLELDCLISGLSGASARIRREQEQRRQMPRATIRAGRPT